MVISIHFRSFCYIADIVLEFQRCIGMVILRPSCMAGMRPTYPACRHAWQRQFADISPCWGAETWLLWRQKALASKRRYVRALAGPDDSLKGDAWPFCLLLKVLQLATALLKQTALFTAFRLEPVARRRAFGR